MSLEKFITFVASCDLCSNTLDTDQDEWHPAIAEMKSNGWKVRKDGRGEWEHACDACIEKELAESKKEEAVPVGGNIDDFCPF